MSIKLTLLGQSWLRMKNFHILYVWDTTRLLKFLLFFFLSVLLSWIKAKNHCNSNNDLSNLQKFPDFGNRLIRIPEPDPKNRISYFLHVVPQIKGLCEPVSKLQKFPGSGNRLIRNRIRRTGFLTFGM